MKQKIAYIMLMGLITTGIISIIHIGINRGFNHGFLWVWMKSWLISYLVVIPVILLISPIIKRMTEYLFRERIHVTQDECN